ncbi:Uncharacterised protein [Mycobacteroides abscessus subsp. abscessus]|nr:Uncharacterised protein [Mycobacteroides abscessus subsp. abscessus]
MPYKKRVYTPERFYHIISRGNRRDPLFRNASDFQAFLELLVTVTARNLSKIDRELDCVNVIN